MTVIPLDDDFDDTPDPDEVEADEELAKLDDFDDLNADLAAAMQQASARTQLQSAQCRLKKIAHSRKPDHERERDELVAIVRKLEEGIVWSRTANVILLHEQHCTTCGSTHRFSFGWWLEQQHRTDPNSRRLLRGKAIEPLPEKVEVHQVDPVDVCPNCAESVVLINAAIKENAREVHLRPAVPLYPEPQYRHPQALPPCPAPAGTSAGDPAEGLPHTEC